MVAMARVSGVTGAVSMVIIDAIYEAKTEGHSVVCLEFGCDHREGSKVFYPQRPVPIQINLGGRGVIKTHGRFIITVFKAKISKHSEFGQGTGAKAGLQQGRIHAAVKSSANAGDF